MLQQRMVQSALSDLPLAYELVMALAQARQSKATALETGAVEPVELGNEDVALAAWLANSLRPIAQSIASLFTATKVVVIKPASYGEMISLIDMLECAVDRVYGREGIGVAVASDERYPLILSTSHTGFHIQPDKVLSAAYRAGAPVFCVFFPGYEDDDTRSVQQVADVIVVSPKVTLDLVRRAFLAAFDDVPKALANYSGFEMLDTRVLGGIIRPSRSIDDCMRTLARIVLPAGRSGAGAAGRQNAHEDLGSAFGYGEARNWALDLAADYALWRAGKLDWLEVPNRALLLSGPPGTGKSTFPKLLANSLGAPLIETSVAEWNAHRNLSGTLEQMTSVFASIPQGGGILFIDEIDGIGRRDQPDLYHRSYWDQIVNQLLTLVSQAMLSPGVVLVGATNYPDRIDPALLRSGRIERQIRLNLPDEQARAGIARHYAGACLSEKELHELAELTEGCSGADLERLVRDASATARRGSRPLEYADILLEIARPLDQLDAADRYRIRVYRQGRKLIADILNTKFGDRLAYPTIDELRDQLAVLMAGRVAEEIMIGQASVLGEEDLARARAIAEAIETRWGMGAIGSGKGATQVGPQLSHAALRAGRLLSENLTELQRRCEEESRQPISVREAASQTLH